LSLRFPFLTISYFRGWGANKAWGSYWSWYLKETRALITELYLLVIYRLTKNNMAGTFLLFGYIISESIF